MKKGQAPFAYIGTCPIFYTLKPYLFKYICQVRSAESLWQLLQEYNIGGYSFSM